MIFSFIFLEWWSDTFCFSCLFYFHQNGHKHYISGWFTDRSVEIDPASAVDTVLQLRLPAFVHASDERLDVSDKVLVKIGDWYLQYNRAKLYNFQTEEKDTVTVTRADSEEAVSERLATLTTGQSFAGVQVGALNSLAVAVCEVTVSESNDVIDYAVVRFHLGDSDGSDLCSRQDVTDMNSLEQADTDGAEKNTSNHANDTSGQVDNTNGYYPTDPDGDSDLTTGYGNPDSYILERKGDSEESDFMESPMFPLLLALGCLFLLCVSAFISYKCLRRREAAAKKPRIRLVRNCNNPDNMKINRHSTRDLSDTEESDVSESSDGPDRSLQDANV